MVTPLCFGSELLTLTPSLLSTPFVMGFLGPSVGGGDHNFLVFAPVTTKLGTVTELDLFYTMVAKFS